MAFASFDKKGGGAPLAEINMVPLIDVMLVLLVIFIVAAPLLSHSVKLELPKASATPLVAKADKIDFSIDADGVRYWNSQAISREEAAARFAIESTKQPQPEVHLSAHGEVAYKLVAETLADASSAGLSKIGFVTQPEAGGAGKLGQPGPGATPQKAPTATRP